jgi:hypothetical protein
MKYADCPAEEGINDQETFKEFIANPLKIP